MSADEILQRKVEDFQYEINEEDLYRIRNTYHLQIYQEPKWIIAIYVATILTALSAILQVVLTYSHAADADAQAKQLKELYKQREQTLQLRQELKVTRDSLKLLESQNDSLRRPPKPEIK